MTGAVDVYAQLKDPVALVVFLLTLSIPVMIGLLTMHRMKKESDFLVGSRTMSKWVVALSAVSSGRSSWLVLGVSGLAYMTGIGAVWAVTGYILAELFQFVYIGKKLRHAIDADDSMTILDYYENRFADSRGRIRVVGAVIIGIFMTAYVAAQLSAGARALNAGMGVSLHWGLVLSVVLILVYMLLGGFIAVAYNDVIRAVIMLIGLVIFPIYGVYHLGGLRTLLTQLSLISGDLLNPWASGFWPIAGLIGVGLGCPGQPHIIVRYMAVKDADQLRYSTVIGTIWNVLLAWGAIYIGLIARVMYSTKELLPNADPEMAYLLLSSEFFGPVLYGLLIGGIFAAILSTADSQLLVVSSTMVRDIYTNVIARGKEVSESHKLFLCRIILLLSALAAMAMAVLIQDLIFWLVLFAWGGLGAAFGTTLICSLYWKRTTTAGVIAGMLTGTAVVVIWKQCLGSTTGVYELIPGFFLGLLTTILVSLATQPSTAD
jgi:solute:Na+ symporter, SSS family